VHGWWAKDVFPGCVPLFIVLAWLVVIEASCDWKPLCVVLRHSMQFNNIVSLYLDCVFIPTWMLAFIYMWVVFLCMFSLLGFFLYHLWLLYSMEFWHCVFSTLTSILLLFILHRVFKWQRSFPSFIGYDFLGGTNIIYIVTATEILWQCFF
jgi:hypothetical protein